MITEILFSLLILTFSSSTVIDSSSTTTSDCGYDKSGRLTRCSYDFDRARFFDRAVPLSEPVDEPVQQSSSGSGSLSKYFRADGSRIADPVCHNVYDLLFPQCFNDVFRFG